MQFVPQCSWKAFTWQYYNCSMLYHNCPSGQSKSIKKQCSQKGRCFRTCLGIIGIYCWLLGWNRIGLGLIIPASVIGTVYCDVKLGIFQATITPLSPTLFSFSKTSSLLNLTARYSIICLLNNAESRRVNFFQLMRKILEPTDHHQREGNEAKIYLLFEARIRGLTSVRRGKNENISGFCALFLSSYFHLHRLILILKNTSIGEKGSQGISNFFT